MSSDKIRAAVETCLEELAGHGAPMQHVPKFIAALEQQPGWTESELWSVHARVIQRLARNQEPPA